MATSNLGLDSIIGHSKPKKLLREAAAKNKLAHAYLFRGPGGVGKKRTAVALASYLNCKKTREEDACSHCSSCRKFFSGNHPDLIIVQPDGAAIKIGQVRELKHQLTFPPLEASVRVVILEDVNTMRREAANSLLKTLEEPTPGSLLILTADLSGDVLPTILSRCQVIPFGPLDYGEMAQVLMLEDNLEESEALALAAVAEGSLGRAKSLLQGELLALRQEVIDELLLGQHDQGEKVIAVFRACRKAETLKENISELFALLRLWYRDLVLVSTGGPAASVANKDLAASLAEASQRWDLAQLHEKLHRIDKAERQLLRNCSRSLVLETLFFDLI